MSAQRESRDRDAPKTGSALRIVVGVALWVLSELPWVISVDDDPTAFDVTTYISLLLHTAGVLLALVGIRRLLGRVQPRLARSPAPTGTNADDATAPAPAGRRTRLTPRTLITAGVLLVVAVDVFFTLLPASGEGIAMGVLVAGLSVASFVGPVLVLVGVYRLLRQVDRHLSASKGETGHASAVADT